MVAVRKRVEAGAQAFDRVRPDGWARRIPEGGFCFDTLIMGVFGSQKVAVQELLEVRTDARKTTELFRALGLMTMARTEPDISLEIESLKSEWLKQIEARLVA